MNLKIKNKKNKNDDVRYNEIVVYSSYWQYGTNLRVTAACAHLKQIADRVSEHLHIGDTNFAVNASIPL